MEGFLTASEIMEGYIDEKVEIVAYDPKLSKRQRKKQGKNAEKVIREAEA